MLKFPCNHCCLKQYYEFKNIIEDEPKKDQIVMFNCCLFVLFILFL